MKKSIIRFKPARLLTAALVLSSAAVSTAHAGDAEGIYGGYFRAGVGSNSEKGSQACFGLEGVAKYRLGNECDLYGEFGYSKQLAKSANGTTFVGTLMAATYSPTSDVGDAKFSLAQMFVEAKGLPFLAGGTAWVGKRFYNRPDVHVLDFKFVQMDGVGAGIDGIAAGPGKFSYALFRNDIDRSTAATRHNFIYQDLPVNPNGTLRFDATLINADSSVARNYGGWSLSVAHKQSQILGGDNTLALQYGVGPGIKIGGTGDLALNSDFTRTRLIDQMIWQVTPEFSGSANVVYQRDKSNAGTTTWTSFGVRPVYAITENIKLQLDVGHDRIKPASGGPVQQLTKVTFAPTLAVAKNFWSRPELRAFVTYAKWNDAAQAAATPLSSLSRTGVFGASTNGTSVGVQVETWF